MLIQLFGDGKVNLAIVCLYFDPTASATWKDEKIKYAQRKIQIITGVLHTHFNFPWLLPTPHPSPPSITAMGQRRTYFEYSHKPLA